MSSLQQTLTAPRTEVAGYGHVCAHTSVDGWNRIFTDRKPRTVNFHRSRHLRRRTP